MTKQREDAGEDGQQVVLHAEQAERNEQGHGGFRAVGGAGEAVEAEDGNAGGDADVGFVLVVGGQRAAKEKV